MGNSSSSENSQVPRFLSKCPRVPPSPPENEVEAQFEELLREKGVATVVIEDICAMENIETKWLYVFIHQKAGSISDRDWMDPKECVQQILVLQYRDQGLRNLFQGIRISMIMKQKRWVEKFLNAEGLEALLVLLPSSEKAELLASASSSSFLKSRSSSQSMLIQSEKEKASDRKMIVHEEVLNVLFTLANFNKGIFCMVHSNNCFIRLIATFGTSSSTQLKARILKLLGIICCHSQASHDAVLNAFTSAAAATASGGGTGGRFENIARNFKNNSSDPNFQGSILMFLNIMINTTHNIEHRMTIRQDLEYHGFTEMLEVYRQESKNLKEQIPALDMQVQMFFKALHTDLTKSRRENNKNNSTTTTTTNSTFNSIPSSPPTSPCSSSELSSLSSSAAAATTTTTVAPQCLIGIAFSGTAQESESAALNTSEVTGPAVYQQLVSQIQQETKDLDENVNKKLYSVLKNFASTLSKEQGSGKELANLLDKSLVPGGEDSKEEIIAAAPIVDSHGNPLPPSPPAIAATTDSHGNGNPLPPSPPAITATSGPDISKFRKLLSMGAPLGAVKARMIQAGVDPSLIDAPAPVVEEKASSKENKEPTQKTEEEPTKAKVLVKDHPDYTKFFKLLAVGAPAEAVKAKMKHAGLRCELLDTPDAEYVEVVAPAAVSPPPAAQQNLDPRAALNSLFAKRNNDAINTTASTAESSKNSTPQVLVKDDPEYAKFFKLITMGAPAEMVKAKMRMAGLIPELLDTPEAVLSEAMTATNTNTSIKMNATGKLTLPPRSLPPAIRQTTRSFYWEQLKGDEVKGMIWEELEMNDASDQGNQQNSSSIELTSEDISALEHDFPAQKPTEPKSNTHHRRTYSMDQVSSLPRVVFLIDRSRSNNISIIVKQFKMSHAGLREAIMKLDTTVLTLERVQGLLKILPTDEEVTAINGFQGDPNTLNDAERILKMLMSIPRLKPRLVALQYKLQFPNLVKDLQSKMLKVRSACEEISNSPDFKSILRLVLQIGNKMNQGTCRGNAKGYRLNDLIKLGQLKAADKTSTLLHFVARILRQKRGNIVRLGDTLPSLYDVQNIPIAELQIEMDRILELCQYIATEFAAYQLKYSLEDKEECDNFEQVMVTFIGTSASTTNILKEEMSMSLKVLQKTMERFEKQEEVKEGEERENNYLSKASAFFQHIYEFSGSLMKADRENEIKRMREERRHQKRGSLTRSMSAADVRRLSEISREKREATKNSENTIVSTSTSTESTHTETPVQPAVVNVSRSQSIGSPKKKTATKFSSVNLGALLSRNQVAAAERLAQRQESIKEENESAPSSPTATSRRLSVLTSPEDTAPSESVSSPTKVKAVTPSSPTSSSSARRIPHSESAPATPSNNTREGPASSLSVVTAPELLNTGSTFEVQHETTDTSISPTMTCRTPKSIQGSSRRISHSESAPATPSNNTRKGPASSLSVVTAPELLSVGSTFDENTDKFMTPTMTYRTPKSCRGSYSEKVGGTSSSSRRYSYSNRPSPRIASMEEIRHFLGVKLQQLEKDQAKIKQEETQAQSCEPEETSAYKNETEEDDDVQKEIPVDNNNNEVESNNIALSSPTKSSTDSTVASTATASTLVEA